jgi:hypothetical protein
MTISLTPSLRSDPARQARSLRDKADSLLALQSELEQQARELRERSRALEEQQRALAARIREQGQRENRALDDYVSETIAQGRRALLGDEQTSISAADVIVATPVSAPAYSAARVAAEIVRQGKIRRGEALDEQPQQANRKDADLLADADRIINTSVASANYDPAKVAAMIIAAGRLRRAENGQ